MDKPPASLEEYVDKNRASGRNNMATEEELATLAEQTRKANEALLKDKESLTAKLGEHTKTVEKLTSDANELKTKLETVQKEKTKLAEDLDAAIKEREKLNTQLNEIRKKSREVLAEQIVGLKEDKGFAKFAKPEERKAAVDRLSALDEDSLKVMLSEFRDIQVPKGGNKSKVALNDSGDAPKDPVAVAMQLSDEEVAAARQKLFGTKKPLTEVIR